MSDDAVCGSTDTADGTPCERPAGWGTGSDIGPCVDHDDTAPSPDRPGRPEKLTDERREAIAEMLEEGHSIGAAARSNGITAQTFYNWMERGADADGGSYADFFDRIVRARGRGEARYVDAIIEIARENDDTAALMAMLKDRYPESWGDVDRGEQSDGGGGVQVVLPEEAVADEGST